LFDNTIKYFGGNQQYGLTYNPNDTVADLVNKSTTGDGIPDWEKVLWGLDPKKSENVPGVPDSVTIAKLQQEANGASSQATVGTTNSSANLTQTDQFSREFLATITTLQANGAIDASGNMNQATMDNLTNTLENNVQNSPQRKIYTLSDIKIINSDSTKTIETYKNALINFYPKNPINVTNILQRFAVDDTGNDANPTVLPELDPAIKQMSDFLNGMIKTPVPQSFASLHLDTMNALESVIENLNDVQLYNTDPIVAFSGMSKYVQDSTTLESNSQALISAITQKLGAQ